MHTDIRCIAGASYLCTSHLFACRAICLLLRPKYGGKLHPHRITSDIASRLSVNTHARRSTSNVCSQICVCVQTGSTNVRTRMGQRESDGMTIVLCVISRCGGIDRHLSCLTPSHTQLCVTAFAATEQRLCYCVPTPASGAIASRAFTANRAIPKNLKNASHKASDNQISE